ncbi:uncharacterized protein TRAVEDRAFT_48355 [Trametes versicolor FP-101664 SS1]|uniref:uncharacterized protein n=1 Tax=Trametes versicolor (strain FP-101664) TaxID=717944 RepID=UPI0004622BDE|nr:uncharacterized protein TRAVEDRAFT_48355 [Trametes versicolor FP-101664 SS1]EIW57314.1 hypothetical protein TRAVEDRAFT_48355 [Trametes versicolor FP-101664 SS1]
MESLAPVLNYDILLEVMKMCERPDCSRFMRTCRFFHTHGFEALLSHDISTSTEEDLTRVLAFLRKDPDKRFKFVRSMQFDFPELTDTATLELADALRRMVNLTALSIQYSEDIILSEPEPALFDAIAALTSLRELDLHYAGEHSIRLLQSLRSELVEVNVHILDMTDCTCFFDTVPADDRPLYHPAVLLQHSRSTLQELFTYEWYMDADTPPDPTLVYPQMWRLDLERSLFPCTLPLINAYPNLTHLCFHTGESEHQQYLQSKIEAYDTRHALNVSQQQASVRTWESLHEYSGSLVDLYLLGLTCPINRVYLHSMPTVLRHMLPTVLAYARPRDLTLQNWPMQLRDNHPAEVFAALRGEGVSRLEAFCIEARLEQDDGAVDIAAVLEGLRASLLSAPLQELRMNIGMQPDCESVAARAQWHPRDPPPDREESPSMCLAERSAEDFDLEGCLRQFMEDVPTLRRANIELNGPKDRWRFATIVDGKLQIEERRS